jgi:uncharacterized BrkB/YihY/UPF0761 family membrane protein
VKMEQQNQIFRHSPESVSKIIEQEAIVIMPAQGKVNVFNELGSLIWTLSDGNSTVTEIVNHICEDYDVPREQVEHDVFEFIERLVTRGMLVISK